jgi:hypothetical protein
MGVFISYSEGDAGMLRAFMRKLRKLRTNTKQKRWLFGGKG